MVSSHDRRIGMIMSFWCTYILINTFIKIVDFHQETRQHSCVKTFAQYENNIQKLNDHKLHGIHTQNELIVGICDGKMILRINCYLVWYGYWCAVFFIVKNFNLICYITIKVTNYVKCVTCNAITKRWDSITYVNWQQETIRQRRCMMLKKKQ